MLLVRKDCTAQMVWWYCAVTYLGGKIGRPLPFLQRCLTFYCGFNLYLMLPLSLVSWL